MKIKRKKDIIIIAIISVLAIGMTVGFGFLIYYYLFGTSPTVRKKMVNHYSNDSNYVAVYAKISSAPYRYNDGLVGFDVEFIGEINKGFIANSAHSIEIPSSNYDILVENGFDFDDRETVYKFIASSRIWWDGGQPFAAAVFSEDEQTVYLDYETGKSNLIYFIKNDMN